MIQAESLAAGLVGTTSALAISRLGMSGVDLLGIQKYLSGRGGVLSHDFTAPAVTDRAVPTGLAHLAMTAPHGVGWIRKVGIMRLVG